MFIAICINVILLAIDQYPPLDDKVLDIFCNIFSKIINIKLLDLINLIITCLFIGEVLIKIIG